MHATARGQSYCDIERRSGPRGNIVYAYVSNIDCHALAHATEFPACVAPVSLNIKAAKK